LLGLLVAAGCGDSDPSALPTPPVFNLDVRGDALFVALGPMGSVAVVDIDAWKVAGTLALSTRYQPHHLSLSPDRRHIGVGAPAIDLSGGHAGHTGHGAEPTGGALYILDSQKGDVTAQVLPGGTAHNLAFVDNTRVGYALMESGRLVLAGAADLVPSAEVAVGTVPLEVSPSSVGLLVANSGSGSISVVSLPGAGPGGDPPAVSATLPVGANPIAAWVGAAGRAYVTSESDQKLTALALAERKAEPTVVLPGRPGQALEVGGPTGEVWVALEDQAKILVLNATDLAVKTEIVVGKKPHGLCLSGHGYTVFLTDEADGRIYSIDVRTRAVLRSLFVGGAPNGIVFRAAL
jgi:DNA-binding beta-propeller fold protein YncE